MANVTTTDFPIQNLPLGVFRVAGGGAATIGVAIGDQILDLRASSDLGLLNGLPNELRSAAGASTLNPLMALGHESASLLRHHVSRILAADNPARDPRALRPLDTVTLELPRCPAIRIPLMTRDGNADAPIEPGAR